MKLQGNTLLGAVTALTALGFMQIGYDNGVMGGLVNQTAFNDTFDSPGSTMIGVIVSLMEIGAFIGSVSSAFFGERIGRRKSIAVGVVILILGALLQATAYHRSHLIVGRVVSGVGLGIVNSTVPVMQVEFSPKATRGLYVCMQLSTLNFGILLAYWIDYGFSTHIGSYAWRVPVILQCAFLFPMLLLVFLVDETPRWLAAHDRQDQALQVLHRLYTDNMHESDITALHEDILRTVALEKAVGAGSWKDLLRNDEIQSQRRFLIACAIQIFQQLGGINAIIYYSATLFEKSVGFSKHMSALMSGFLQTWFFVASFIPWFLIDRVGRRPLLLSMISTMAAVMAVQSALIYQVQNNTSIAHTSGIAAAAMLFIFQGAFTIGFQATVWVYPSEILPLRLRQRGSSISTASNWICNYLVVQITPPAISNIGWKTYIIFAVLNALWVPIIYFFFPETKGLQLEEVDRLFADGIEQFTGQSYTTKDCVRHVEEART
ncbi:sugar porter family MFS transporter [Aspergillus novofumigatus IBT 16806]|uniref:Putative hexose carrier protein n=1 Tax=Aspergillus novofumigatus (strain IBT 16806) TaxID=1392255 RepID=A0A2I1BXS7_ASPN1|nr:putative hexose carrier protein [Aspergillus novofumigatus IBT 16806]PKX90195.1 putative hexose carrier protein [Aspergillus novofumigatus IBT 16806]